MMEESPLELKGNRLINSEPFTTAHTQKNATKILFKVDSYMKAVNRQMAQTITVFCETPTDFQ